MDGLPPDPYAALGVAKDATAAAIKSQYRKLVLKFHPDKVQDEAQKQAASDQFHRVQTAYEIVGDDTRRQRYDAQCRLVELRREVMEHGGGGARSAPDVRTAAFKVPTESPYGGDYFARGPERSGQMSPQYEERRPSGYADYFDIPRSNARKDDDFDRSSKRASPREDPKKSKTSSKKSKENERASREEKSRRTEQDKRRDRDRKFQPYVTVEESPNSDSDEYKRARRRRREEGEMQRARDSFEENRKYEEAAASFFGEDRAAKMWAQQNNVREYIATRANIPPESPTVERRPSPTRKNSSRENIEQTKRKEARPDISFRRGSGRPTPSRRDTEKPKKSSTREKERRPSLDLVDQPEEMPRRPPTLNQTKSSPADIRPPFERQRSNSWQQEPKEEPMPFMMSRANTMPYPSPNGDHRPKGSSKLRTEYRGNLPTPDTSPEPPSNRVNYGRKYADDIEFATPDGYRTEVREPAAKQEAGRQRFTRSPSPIREPRERQRSTSSKQAPPPNKRTMSTTQYKFPPDDVAEFMRPTSLSRENSGRPNTLFGELPTTASPRVSSRKYSPPAEEIRYSPKARPEDVKTASGYKIRSSRDRPYSRTNSGTPIQVK